MTTPDGRHSVRQSEAGGLSEALVSPTFARLVLQGLSPGACTHVYTLGFPPVRPLSASPEGPGL